MKITNEELQKAQEFLGDPVKGVGLAVENFEKEHIPISNPGRDECLNCPVLIAGIPELFSLCCRCLEKAKNAIKRKRKS